MASKMKTKQNKTKKIRATMFSTFICRKVIEPNESNKNTPVYKPFGFAS